MRKRQSHMTKRFIVAAVFMSILLPASKPVCAASDPAHYIYDITEGVVRIEAVSNAGFQVQYGPWSSVQEDIPVGTSLTIIGDSACTHWIEVNDGGADLAYDIALQDVNIDARGVGAAFSIAGGTVNLTLEGVNTLVSHDRRAGLEIDENGSLSISGVGSLSAVGGRGGAGIGGKLAGTAGPITINSTAVIKAEGGAYGAGIGGGDCGGSSAVAITGGTVEAVGGACAAGIGGGRGGNFACIEINGSAHIKKAQGGDADAVNAWAGGAGIGSGGWGSTFAVVAPAGLITISAGVDMDAISGGAARDGFTAGASIGTGGAAEIGCVPYAGLHTMTYHAHSQPDVTQALTYTVSNEGSDAILPLLYNIQAYNPDFTPAQFEGFWYDIADEGRTNDVMPDDGAPDDAASSNGPVASYGNDSVSYAAGMVFPDTNVSHVYAQAVQELSQEEQQALAYLNQPYNEYVEMVRSLQQDNGDVKGWIRVEGTVINYPLLQGEDNDFYAKHNYEKREITYGSIYMNSRSNLKDNTSNIIIYGHNMKDNQMFGSLSWYSDPSYYNAHPIVHIATDETESAYQIICAFRSRVYPVDFDPAVFRYYRHVSFPDAQTFSDYLQNCKNLQLYETGITAEYGDQLILLSTCEYTQVNGRFVVLAKKLPAGAAL